VGLFSGVCSGEVQSVLRAAAILCFRAVRNLAAAGKSLTDLTFMQTDIEKGEP